MGHSRVRLSWLAELRNISVDSLRLRVASNEALLPRVDFAGKHVFELKEAVALSPGRRVQ